MGRKESGRHSYHYMIDGLGGAILTGAATGIAGGFGAKRGAAKAAAGASEATFEELPSILSKGAAKGAALWAGVTGTVVGMATNLFSTAHGEVVEHNYYEKPPAAEPAPRPKGKKEAA